MSLRRDTYGEFKTKRREEAHFSAWSKYIGAASVGAASAILYKKANIGTVLKRFIEGGNLVTTGSPIESEEIEIRRKYFRDQWKYVKSFQKSIQVKKILNRVREYFLDLKEMTGSDNVASQVFKRFWKKKKSYISSLLTDEQMELEEAKSLLEAAEKAVVYVANKFGYNAENCPYPHVAKVLSTYLPEDQFKAIMKPRVLDLTKGGLLPHINMMNNLIEKFKKDIGRDNAAERVEMYVDSWVEREGKEWIRGMHQKLANAFTEAGINDTNIMKATGDFIERSIKTVLRTSAGIGKFTNISKFDANLVMVDNLPFLRYVIEVLPGQSMSFDIPVPVKNLLYIGGFPYANTKEITPTGTYTVYENMLRDVERGFSHIIKDLFTGAKRPIEVERFIQEKINRRANMGAYITTEKGGLHPYYNREKNIIARMVHDKQNMRENLHILNQVKSVISSSGNKTRYSISIDTEFFSPKAVLGSGAMGKGGDSQLYQIAITVFDNKTHKEVPELSKTLFIDISDRVSKNDFVSFVTEVSGRTKEEALKLWNVVRSGKNRGKASTSLNEYVKELEKVIGRDFNIVGKNYHLADLSTIFSNLGLDEPAKKFFRGEVGEGIVDVQPLYKFLFGRELGNKMEDIIQDLSKENIFVYKNIKNVLSGYFDIEHEARTDTALTYQIYLALMDKLNSAPDDMKELILMGADILKQRLKSGYADIELVNEFSMKINQLHNVHVIGSAGAFAKGSIIPILEDIAKGKGVPSYKRQLYQMLNGLEWAEGSLGYLKGVISERYHLSSEAMALGWFANASRELSEMYPKFVQRVPTLLSLNIPLVEQGIGYITPEFADKFMGEYTINKVLDFGNTHNMPVALQNYFRYLDAAKRLGIKGPANIEKAMPFLDLSNTLMNYFRLSSLKKQGKVLTEREELILKRGKRLLDTISHRAMAVNKESDLTTFIKDALRQASEITKKGKHNWNVKSDMYNDMFSEVYKMMKTIYGKTISPDDMAKLREFSGLRIEDLAAYGVRGVSPEFAMIKMASRQPNGKISIQIKLNILTEKVVSAFEKLQLSKLGKGWKGFDMIMSLKYMKQGDYFQFLKSVLENTELELLEKGKKAEAQEFVRRFADVLNDIHHRMLASLEKEYGNIYEKSAEGGVRSSVYKFLNSLSGLGDPFSVKGYELFEKLEFPDPSMKIMYYKYFFDVLKQDEGYYGLGKISDLVADYMSYSDNKELVKAARLITQEARKITGDKTLKLNDAIRIVRSRIKEDRALSLLEPVLEALENPTDKERLSRIPRIFRIFENPESSELIAGQVVLNDIAISTLGTVRQSGYTVRVPMDAMLYLGGRKGFFEEFYEGIVRFMNMDKVDVLSDLTRNGFTLNPNDIRELAENGQASIIGIKELANIISKYKDALSHRLYVSKSLLNDKSKTFDEILRVALQNPGEYIRYGEEPGFEKVDRLLINGSVYAKIRDELLSLFKKRKIPRDGSVYVNFGDIGLNFVYSKKFLETYNFSAEEARTFQNMLGNQAAKHLPFASRIVFDKDIYTEAILPEERVVPNPIMGRLFRTVAMLDDYMKNGVPTKMGTDPVRRLKVAVLNYYNELSNLMGKKGIGASIEVPGFIATGLPSFILKKGSNISEVEFPFFTAKVNPEVISKLADYFKDNGYNDWEIYQIMNGEANVPGLLGRNPTLSALQQMFGSIRADYKAKLNKLYVDPLTAILIQWGDFDADLYNVIFNYGKIKDVNKFFDMMKSVYGISDEDINMWNAYYKVMNSHSHPKALKELAEVLSIEPPSNLSDRKTANEFLSKAESIIEEKNKTISAKIKEHFQSIFGKNVIDEDLGLQRIKIDIKNPTKYFGASGNPIVFPTFYGVSSTGSAFLTDYKVYEKFLERLNSEPGLADLPPDKQLEKIKELFFEGQNAAIFANVIPKTHVGQLNLVLRESNYLMHRIRGALKGGLSYNEIRKLLNIDISDEILDEISGYTDEVFSRKEQVLQRIAQIYDQALKGKRNKAGSLREAFEVSHSFAQGKNINELLRENTSAADLFIKLGLVEKKGDEFHFSGNDSDVVLKMLGLGYKRRIDSIVKIVTGKGSANNITNMNLFNHISGPPPEGLVGELINLVSTKFDREKYKSVSEELLAKGHMFSAGMRYLYDHVDKRYLKAIGLASSIFLGGFLFTPRPFHGDVFSLGFDIGHVTGMDPSMYDAKWVPPELPKEIPISADTTCFNRKTYMVKMMAFNNPRVYNKLRRLGAIEASDMFQPDHYDRVRYSYNMLKYRV